MTIAHLPSKRRPLEPFFAASADLPRVGPSDGRSAGPYSDLITITGSSAGRGWESRAAARAGLVTRIRVTTASRGVDARRMSADRIPASRGIDKLPVIDIHSL